MTEVSHSTTNMTNLVILVFKFISKRLEKDGLSHISQNLKILQFC